MAGFASGQLQGAIYGLLTGDATLMALISGVFDFVPQDPAQAFPYVTIGDDEAKEYATATFDGADTAVTIHSWSRAEGRKEVKQIMERVHDLLHNCSLTMANNELTLMRFEYSTVLLDPDAVTHHGVVRFRALTKGV